MSSSPLRKPDMVAIFAMCRKDEWGRLWTEVKTNPCVATTAMVMDNHISTTILHQAITSKADTADRAKVIQTILELAPEAAKIKNGYGSLPLHVISQRNTKMDSQTKELLIHQLVRVYPDALVQEGGVGKRTPLHIAFTDYISPQLARMMIDAGKAATFKKDKKGWLPIHVAVSRHCSPEKLSMLLEVNPSSLFATTNKGETLLTLAKTSATKSHPNYRLIAELEEKLGEEKRSFIQDDTPSMSSLEPKERETDTPPRPTRQTRKRKAEAANLLLHFSRHEPQINAPHQEGRYNQIHHHHHQVQVPHSFVPARRSLPFHQYRVMYPPNPQQQLHFAMQQPQRFILNPPHAFAPKSHQDFMVNHQSQFTFMTKEKFIPTQQSIHYTSPQMLYNHAMVGEMAQV